MKPNPNESGYFGFQMNQGQAYPMQMNPQMMGTMPMPMPGQMGLPMPGMQPMMNAMPQQPSMQGLPFPQANPQMPQPMQPMQQFPGMRPMTQLPGQMPPNMPSVQMPGMQQQMPGPMVPNTMPMGGQFGYQPAPKQFPVPKGQTQPRGRRQQRKRDDGDSDEFEESMKPKRPSVTTIMKPEPFPMAGQPAPSPVDMSQETQALMSALQKLTDSEVLLFFTLMGCNAGRDRGERAEVFSRIFAPKLVRLFPSAPKILAQFVEQIHTSKTVQNKLREPKLPLVFRRVPGSRKIYKNMLLEWPQFDILLTRRERKSIILGSFLSFSESVPRDIPKSMRVDQQAPLQMRFGEREEAHFFILPNKETGRYEIQFSGQSSKQALVLWCVVQMVEAKTPVEVVSEIVARAGLQLTEDQVRNLSARTSKCRDDCCFNVCRVIEELISVGEATCPCCKAKVNISEIHFLESDQVKVSMLQHDAAELRAAREAFSDQLAAMMRPAQRTRENWMDFLLNADHKETVDYQPVTYATTDEFQRCLHGFAATDCL